MDAPVREAYIAILVELAECRQATISDATQDIYAEKLYKHRVEPSALKLACDRIAESASLDYQSAFPRIGDLLVACDRVRVERQQSKLMLEAATDDGKTYRCLRCFDSPDGWLEPFLCPDDLQCERQATHTRHWYTARCPCWLTRHADRIGASVSKEMLNGGHSIPSRVARDLMDMDAGVYRYHARG